MVSNSQPVALVLPSLTLPACLHAAYYCMPLLLEKKLRWVPYLYGQRQGARDQPAYSKELQTARARSLEGYLGGKGQQQILFRAILD